MTTVTAGAEKVPKRILRTLMSAASAGVVPRCGAPYIAIGRQDEVKALLSDLELAADGGATMRFIVGKYGSGKSFLMQLIRGYALDNGFLTADADLSPERKLCGGNGTGRATWRELMRNLASRTMPEGGALPQVLDSWLDGLQGEIAAGGLEPGSEAFRKEADRRIFETIGGLRNMVGGFDFALVLSTYRRAHADGDEEKKAACLRWLRGEYPTRTEAKNELGVTSIIGDDNWYDMLKLLAAFSASTGRKGLVVFLDECVNLYKITNRVSRENNYEKLLAMYNDAMQGRAAHLGMILGGTPQFLEDTRRGLYSYDALKSRLQDTRFEEAGYRNLLGPVIRLRRLSDAELLALILRVTDLHAQCYGWKPRVTEDEQLAFLKYCLGRAGADVMITPREIIRDYIGALNILLQNPDTALADILGSGGVTLTHAGPGEEPEEQPAAEEKEESEHSPFAPEEIEL